MKFQPGQSGNPAGRPLGARNKKTIAMEERLAANADEAVEIIMRLARGGHPAAVRALADRVLPTGTNRPLPLELPNVSCADEAQVALDTVIAAFGRGEITVREFSPMLGSVDRMARVAERIQQNREREHERYKALRVHGIHPSMIPKPTGEPDRMEPILAAIERGEDPFPDDPAASAYVATGERLYSPVNSGDEGAEESPSDTPAPSLPPKGGLWPPSECLRTPTRSVGYAQASEGEGGDPGLDPGEPGGGLLHATNSELAHGAESGGLYSPVNLENDSAAAPPPPGAADAAPPSPASGGG
jgi:hypothetical protein